MRASRNLMMGSRSAVTQSFYPTNSTEESPAGVLEVYMTGGSDVFFWVENLPARDLSRSFLGLKKICVFFWVLSPSELFVSGFRCHQ